MRFLILLIFFSHYSFADLSRQEKFEILTEHNKVRAQYNVHNVYNLQWSDKLTSFAQVWANYLSNDNNCTMRHRQEMANTNKNTAKIFFGQAH